MDMVLQSGALCCVSSQIICAYSKRRGRVSISDKGLSRAAAAVHKASVELKGGIQRIDSSLIGTPVAESG
ncbi:hypothetical protein PBY51_007322 [Eleginops maclovinus]|uniref:Uncharacterized protein n=1 Tax=Eleginops maclovinus TaxID=56733 RepID=A0AAN7X8W9_ELEMC|nr:hypothetical protein PBY51_007322 [Eleginops maclovinus]